MTGKRIGGLHGDFHRRQMAPGGSCRRVVHSLHGVVNERGNAVDGRKQRTRHVVERIHEDVVDEIGLACEQRAAPVHDLVAVVGLRPEKRIVKHHLSGTVVRGCGGIETARRGGLENRQRDIRSDRHVVVGERRIHQDRVIGDSGSCANDRKHGRARSGAGGGRGDGVVPHDARIDPDRAVLARAAEQRIGTAALRISLAVIAGNQAVLHATVVEVEHGRAV